MCMTCNSTVYSEYNCNMWQYTCTLHRGKQLSINSELKKSSVSFR
ncbi:unnamed protein product [Acanthoscelides obtectus]|uniref:Uncharacterized protein n=1 Tax=Acanthoscelides obtectus TaxID=200917 RepID=A0A9P0LQB0_ACAOB|nr:unnamed protein product [Acanthoscelides obtectus]CAK1624129.1 hypothetical protein AOBTE_LOCUS2339 [Acanthoscelides obtectus]